jgi:hypothetical protein
MKRNFPVLLLLSALGIISAGPALAAAPTPTPAPKPGGKTTFESHNANAFWYFSEQISKTVRKDTTWYLGAYQSTDGSFSDLYRTVTICTAAKRGGEHCTSSNAYGAIDLSEATFSMDATGLTFAHLEGTYPLQETDEQGNPIGDPVPTSAVADWTGVDQIQLSHGSSTYCDASGCFFDKWEAGYRAADATGTIDGSLALGSTDDANLSYYKDTSGSR